MLDRETWNERPVIRAPIPHNLRRRQGMKLLADEVRQEIDKRISI
jgi:hypothetical protein